MRKSANCLKSKIITSYCLVTDDQGLAVTSVDHDSETPTLVNGYQEPGSYVRPIDYGMTRDQFDELVGKRAYKCEQYIKWECWNARLLSDTGIMTYFLSCYWYYLH